MAAWAAAAIRGLRRPTLNEPAEVKQSRNRRPSRPQTQGPERCASTMSSPAALRTRTCCGVDEGGELVERCRFGTGIGRELDLFGPVAAGAVRVHGRTLPPGSRTVPGSRVGSSACRGGRPGLFENAPVGAIPRAPGGTAPKGCTHRRVSRAPSKEESERSCSWHLDGDAVRGFALRPQFHAVVSAVSVSHGQQTSTQRAVTR